MITTGQVPERVSASGMATTTSIHAASVLQMVIFSLAAVSAALVSGRVAMNGVRPDFLTVAAAKRAMNGGVNSAATKTSACGPYGMNNKASSKGRRIPTSAGSDQPCRRHSNQNWARAGEAKGGRSATRPRRASSQSGTSPRRARATANRAAR